MIESPEGRPAYEPLETDLVRHLNAPILEEDRALVIDAAEGRSFQAMLALGALPEESEFPGSAELLFAPLEAVDFPVDCVAHCRWLGNRDAVARVRRRIVDADNAFSEQLTSAHGPLSFRAEENRQVARELDAYLRSHERPPLLNTAISFAVGAPSREELERRVEALSHRFGTVSLYRPLGLQPALFLDHLPRADGGTVRDYADVLTIEQFGALMAIGTHVAGSERGVLIGRTVSGGLRPVKFDVTEASRTGRPPSMLLAGTLGSGKTIAAELLAFQAERRGSLVVDVDPKPDHNLEGLPELDGTRACHRALGRGSLPRSARSARRRARGAARGPHQLLSDRPAAPGAAGMGDPDPQGRASSDPGAAALVPASAGHPHTIC